MKLGIDGNWYLHRLYHTMPENSKDPTAFLARRFLSSICRDALFAKAQSIAVAFDGNNVFRYKLYPDYKGNREGGGNVYDYLQPVIDYLSQAGVHVIQFPAYEGDDVLASLAQAGPILISTGDKDAYQYLVDEVCLLNPMHKPTPKITTHKDVPKLIGVKASQALDYQTLIGDKGDNVPQLMTPAKVVKGLTAHGSIKNWLAADPEFRKAMKKQRAALELNRKLVRLVTTLKVKTKPVEWVGDLEGMPTAYADYYSLCNRKTKSLF